MFVHSCSEMLSKEPWQDKSTKIAAVRGLSEMGRWSFGRFGRLKARERDGCLGLFAERWCGRLERKGWWTSQPETSRPERGVDAERNVASKRRVDS